ncbi:gas vesicle protein GvpG [Georgenia sp. SUBG003]|uniref:gas vesicle protein GvpG n=1 Tax=Georgenia sp. SUBG003 TaxID=1497974 RepID=UPI0004D9D7C3|nr:gas vesicle protein [Georgenia sp. SUBG003]
MGLLSGLLTLPLAPVRGTVWVAQQVLDEAEREYYDVGKIRRQLDDVSRGARAGGRSGDEEADTLEESLVARLIEANRRTRQGEGR